MRNISQVLPSDLVPIIVEPPIEVYDIKPLIFGIITVLVIIVIIFIWRKSKK